MTIPAYIYARFSSQEQGKGTSLKRQFDHCRAYIKSRDWEYPDFEKGSPERDIADEGRSAYSGANRQPGGQLYEFERQAKLGHFRNGAVLVLEHLDRLTRQGWEEAFDILKVLMAAGVNVATIDSDQFYPAYGRIEMSQIMLVIVKAEAAHDASHEKSKRLKKAWQEKITAIQNGDKRAFTKGLPAWLVMDPQSRLMAPHPHRVTVLKEIYDWYEAGYGLPKIVQMLNERGEPSWAAGKKDKGQGWNSAYLHKLLTNRAVMGEFEPMSRSHGGSKEISKGIRVLDYYPRVIEADQFNRITAVRASRTGTGGRTKYRLNNLFAGMMFCGSCRAPMYYMSQQRAGRPTNHRSKLDGRKLSYVAGIDRSYMVCNNNRRGHKCENDRRFRYEHLEASVLEVLLGLAMDNNSFVMADRVAELSAQVAEQERQLDGKKFELNNISQALRERFSKVLANAAADLEDEIERDQAAIDKMRTDLERERGLVSPDEHLERVREVRSSITSDDMEARYEARQRVKLALNQMASITCNIDGMAYVTLANGLMSWRFDQQGQQVGEPIDLRQNLNLHGGLTRGVLAGNAANVEDVLRRSAV